MSLLKILALILVIGCLSSCKTTQPDESEVLSTIKVDGQTPQYTTSEKRTFFIMLDTTDNKKYGYSPEAPINVGVGPSEQHKYLNSLAGPNGESIRYTRLGSCCPFADPKLSYGGGLLDIYQVFYDGQKQPIKLYLNMYYKDQKLFIPTGLSYRNN